MAGLGFGVFGLGVSMRRTCGGSVGLAAAAVDAVHRRALQARGDAPCRLGPDGEPLLAVAGVHAVAVGSPLLAAALRGESAGGREGPWSECLAAWSIRIPAERPSA